MLVSKDLLVLIGQIITMFIGFEFVFLTLIPLAIPRYVLPMLEEEKEILRKIFSEKSAKRTKYGIFFNILSFFCSILCLSMIIYWLEFGEVEVKNLQYLIGDTPLFNSNFLFNWLNRILFLVLGSFTISVIIVISVILEIYRVKPLSHYLKHIFEMNGYSFIESHDTDFFISLLSKSNILLKNNEKSVSCLISDENLTLRNLKDEISIFITEISKKYNYNQNKIKKLVKEKKLVSGRILNEIESKISDKSSKQVCYENLRIIIFDENLALDEKRRTEIQIFIRNLEESYAIAIKRVFFLNTENLIVFLEKDEKYRS